MFQCHIAYLIISNNTDNLTIIIIMAWIIGTFFIRALRYTNAVTNNISSSVLREMSGIACVGIGH